MTTKRDFLPKTDMVLFDIDDNTSKYNNLTGRRRSCRTKCISTCIPMVGLFTLLFGTTFLGFSILTVNDNEIGYYDNQYDITYTKGLYFQLPWNKGSFHVVNVDPKTVTYWNQVGTTSDRMYYEIKSTKVIFNITNHKTYVNKLKEYGGEQNMLKEISEYIASEIKLTYETTPSNKLVNITNISDIQSPIILFGIEIVDIEIRSVSFVPMGEMLQNLKKKNHRLLKKLISSLIVIITILII